MACFRLEPGDRWVELNVGGEMIGTTGKTLTKFPNSKLAEFLMVPYPEQLPIDIDPVYFRGVLNWLR